MAKNLLVENKANFFTYTLSFEKTTSLIILDLDYVYSTQQIVKDLFAQSSFSHEAASSEKQ